MLSTVDIHIRQIHSNSLWDTAWSGAGFGSRDQFRNGLAKGRAPNNCSTDITRYPPTTFTIEDAALRQT